jgi:hypothetical protein
MNPMMENKPEGKNYEYKETEDTVEQQPFPAALVFEQPKPVNPVMKKNTPFFLGVAILYSICFAVAFYKNFIGIMFPLITAVTLAVCGLFLKKNNILWKKSNWWYLTGCMLLSISTFFTTNVFVIFCNTVGILLLITVFMLRQVYDDKSWNFGRYLGNILFLYLNMIPELASPIVHFANFVKKRKTTKQKNKTALYVFLGVLIGLPMLVTVIALLSSADQIFSRVVGRLFYQLWSQIVFSPNVFIVILLLILGFFGIYSFLSALTLNNMPEWKADWKRKNPIIAITFLSMVLAVYLIFCGIQVIFLFTGGMLLPEGYTYAKYAHQGFFQLLFVCIFNLVLVLCCITVFERNRLLKWLLFLYSGCTYIMIASSAYRMILYIGTYHLSFLRILVLWFLAMLVVLMAGVVITVQNPQFGLFRYCMSTVTIFYLIFSLGRPDALVAEYNMAKQKEDISYEDLVYLAELSMDTIPVLGRYDLPHETCNRQMGTYVSEYDYYLPTAVWGYDGERDKSVPVQSCRRCLLNKKFHEILERTEDMNFRTFHWAKYQAKRVAKENFLR